MSSTRATRIHVTGASGLIGSLVYHHLAGKDGYEVWGSGRRRQASSRAESDVTGSIPDERFIRADLTDYQSVRGALEGMDAVLHFGAVPDADASFQAILDSNIVGTHNVLEACRELGIRRLVYASSLMTSWGYFTYEEPYRSIRAGRLDEIAGPVRRIRHTDPTRPTEPYSASKVWAEGLCRAYSDRGDISVICLRIGYVLKENCPPTAEYDSVFCGHRDITTITELALEATPELTYDIFYAVSDNANRWVDLEHAREKIGYVPADSAEAAAQRTGRNP